MKRLLEYLVVFAAVFILSYNVFFFTLRQVRAAAWGEVLLQGGTLVDGGGGEPYPADLLIRRGRIAAIGKGIKPEPGTRVIRVPGSLLVPGFIATWPGSLPSPEEQVGLLEAGVTTVIGGVDGNSPGEIKRYLRWAARRGLYLNAGTLLGLGGLAPPGRADPGAVRESIQRGLQDGALGLSLNLNRLPDALWRWDDLRQVTAGLHPAPLLVVTCADGDCARVDACLVELRALLQAAGHGNFRPYIRELRLPRNASPAGIQAVLAELEQARAGGVEVGGDLNPFKLTGTPPYLLDQAAGRFSPEELVLATTPTSLRGLQGKSLAAAARELGLPVPDLIRELRGKGVRVEVSAFGGEQALTVVPFLGWQVVHQGGSQEPGDYLSLLAAGGELSLPARVQKLTSLPARLFGLEGRGRLAPGACADLLVLRPQGKGYAPDYVFVSGRPEVIRGRFTKFRSGVLLGSSPGVGVPGRNLAFSGRTENIKGVIRCLSRRMAWPERSWN